MPSERPFAESSSTLGPRVSVFRRIPLGIRIVLGVVILFGVAVAILRRVGGERIVAPRPEAMPDVAASSEVPNSVLTLPVRVQLSALMAEVEDEIPAAWGDINERLQTDNSRVSVALSLSRTPFVASFADSTARLSTTVAYRARGWYDLPLLPAVSASCGTGDNEPRPRLNVALEGPISLTQNWTLSTRTSVAQLAPASSTDRDRCQITFAGIDVTGRVVNAARSFLESHTAAIDSLVAGIDLRPHFEEWWNVLRDPISLSDDVWLELRPVAIGRGDVDGEGDVIEIMATLTAKPRIVLGDEPARWPEALPPLGSKADNGALDILVEAVAEYDAASARLTQTLQGFEVERAGRRMVLRSLDVSGIGGGQVALEATVDGDISGRLFLVGTPAFEPETGYVSVPDLSFAISTSNLLVAGAAWLADAGLESALRERAQWPVDAAVGWAGGKLAEGLNRSLADGVRLEGTVDSVRIVDVTALQRGLFVRAAARANATLFIEGGT